MGTTWQHVLTTCMFLTPLAAAYKVLFIPVPAGSHIVLLSTVAEAWAEVTDGQGHLVHEAHVLKHAAIPVPSQFKNSKVKYFGFGDGSKTHFSQTKEFTKLIGELSKKSFFEVAPLIGQLQRNVCKEVLTENGLHERLKKEKFDFVVVDSMPGINCLHAVPHRLEVPYGSLSVLVPPNMFSTTLQVNYLGPSVPFFYSKNFGFLRRFGQFFAIQMMRFGARYAQDHQTISDYIKDRPIDDLDDLVRNSKIWLIDNEPLVDYAKHAAPNMIHVGCVSASPARPLPADLAKVADAATRGLIVVSFGGSMTATFPDDTLRRLLDGLSNLRQSVILRLATTPTSSVPKNVHLTKWLPQNDLLAHPNTVLFITHCGMSSINEAVYHGVPMLGFPNQDEQRFNAIKFSDKNYGIMMDRNNFTAEELSDNINMMLKDTKYKTAIKKSSAIIQGRRFTARQEAVYWIDHVIKYGGDHLVPSTNQLAWYQILMYDVMAAILACLGAVFFILYKCCRCVKRCCCGRGKPKEKTS